MVFHVPEKAELPQFICRFVRMIYCNSITHLQLARETREKFPLSRASDKVARRAAYYSQCRLILFSRWLKNTTIPRDAAAPDFLQPIPCAYADDFAVAASSFRLLMTALSQTKLPIST